MKNNILVAVIATAVIFGGGGYYAGMKSAQATTASNAGGIARFGQGGAGGTGGTRGGRGGAGFVTGTILSKDATSITVEMRGGAQGETGGSKIVLLSGSTQVMKSAQGSTDDLSVGQQVTAMGTDNTDGSVTAQSVQIRPPMPARESTSTPSQGTPPTGN